MDPNDWRDYFHMVVPMAHCDFLLLDNTWWSIATQVQHLLRKEGHTAAMARLFSPRTLDEFLSTLEATPHDTQTDLR